MDDVEAGLIKSRGFERVWGYPNARRTSDAPKGDGNSYGLGLSVAKAIVTSLGGDITAQSVPGGDTQFAVTLRAGIAMNNEQ
jgi:signal transduction histidine kinase